MPNNFTDPDVIAEISAQMLLEIRAVEFRPEEPFKLTSGLASPVYVDCRKLISYPNMRETLMDFAVSTLYRNVGFEQFDAIAGGETAGIPFAAWIAQRLSLPMVYVRKKPKGFGRNARIEGDLAVGARTLLVEDLATDGGSKLSFANALRAAEAQTDHSLVIFYYDIFSGADAALAEHGLTLHHLVTWRDVIAACYRSEYADAATLSAVEDFLDDPLSWSENHGGASQISASAF